MKDDNDILFEAYEKRIEVNYHLGKNELMMDITQLAIDNLAKVSEEDRTGFKMAFLMISDMVDAKHKNTLKI